MTSRALVLGGGGPVGVAWESGLLAGMEDAGMDVAAADLIVGTSAGSVVGSQLTLGRAPKELYERQLEPAEPGRRNIGPVDMSGVMAQFLKLYTSDRPQQELLAELGKFALAANTMGEEEWVAGFALDEATGGDRWPERAFKCTAIDTADGSFVAWDRDSGVPLRLAVASSCTVPGIFPPVTINGHRYMDGGVRSTTNGDLAAGYSKVLIVNVTAGVGAARPELVERRRQRFDRELEGLRSSGSEVKVITPDEGFGRAIGMNLMDFTKRREAAEIGYRQGAVEGARLREFWSGS